MSTSSWTPCKSSSPEYVIIFLRFAALRVPTSASKRLAHLSSWKRTPNFTLNFPSASNWENTLLANAKSVYCHQVWQTHIIFHEQLEVNQHHNVAVNRQKFSVTSCQIQKGTEEMQCAVYIRALVSPVQIAEWERRDINKKWMCYSAHIEDHPLCPNFDFFKRVFYFLVRTIFKIFIEFVPILLLFYDFVLWPQGV